MCNPLGRFIFGFARITGKATRVSRNSLEAVGTAGRKSLRALGTLGRRSVSKEPKTSQEIVARLEREIQTLHCRIGRQLAENVIAEQTSPADDPQIQEDLKAVLVKLNQVKELEELIQGQDEETPSTKEQLQPEATFVETAEPAVETAEPAVETAEPAVETTEPAVETTEPVEEETEWDKLARDYSVDKQTTEASEPKEAEPDTETKAQPKAKTTSAKKKSPAKKKKSTDE